MKKHGTNILLLITLLAGIIVLLYPWVSQTINSKNASRVINNYYKVTETIDEDKEKEILAAGEEYNKALAALDIPLLEYKKIPGYEKTVNVNGKGMIGYITIQKINAKLPIYHSTKKEVLNESVGHFVGSSLPIGGASTHSILSAHRGLPTAKLFTDLSKLEMGDIFQITVLNRTITYQVDSIDIVLPKDVTKLEIQEGKDYITLVTCTPYGINSHRLLVRGTRIENPKELKVYVTTEAFKISNVIVALVVASPIILVLLIILMIMPEREQDILDEYLSSKNLKIKEAFLEVK